MHSQVIWKRLYSVKSTQEKGTMYQLNNLIHRTAVPNDPQNHMKASEDFLLLLLHAHVIQAADTIQLFLPQQSVQTTAKYIVNNYVLLTTSQDDSNADQVHLYAKELLTLSLLWFGFHDAIKEGDGNRILRYWKFLLVFKVSGYAKEAVFNTNTYYLLGKLLNLPGHVV